MRIRTAICVLMVTGAAAWAQLNPGTIIPSVRNKLQGAAKAEEQRSNEALGTVPASARMSVPAGNATRVSERSTAPRKIRKHGSVVQTTHSAAPLTTQTISATTHKIRGKRDPFVSVIRPESPHKGPVCTTGKKCLVVGQMALRGVVRSGNTVIAVVQNREGKTYFLHEKDPVFNGQVVRIHPDSIVFRETVIDRAGRQSARDVVKRIEVAPSA